MYAYKARLALWSGLEISSARPRDFSSRPAGCRDRLRTGHDRPYADDATCPTSGSGSAAKHGSDVTCFSWEKRSMSSFVQTTPCLHLLLLVGMSQGFNV